MGKSHLFVKAPCHTKEDTLNGKSIDSVVTHFEKTDSKTDVMPAKAGIQSQLHGFRLSPE